MYDWRRTRHSGRSLVMTCAQRTGPASRGRWPLHGDRTRPVDKLRTGPSPDPGRVSFNRDVRPIMSDTCFRCHGPDKNARVAGMRLDIREEAIRPTRSGRTPIVPGDPDKSEIVARILRGERGSCRRVGAQGTKPEAEGDCSPMGGRRRRYEGHWAYQPVDRPALPASDRPHIRSTPFIQARLARGRLRLRAEADRARCSAA